MRFSISELIRLSQEEKAALAKEAARDVIVVVVFGRTIEILQV